MSDSEIQSINSRLIQLETKFDERWVAHDKRAGERWIGLMDNMGEIKETMKLRPCIEHEKLLLGFNDRIRSLEKWRDIFGWATGVVYMAVIGAIIKKISEYPWTH